MPKFARIESERLYQKIVDQIRVMLESGQLKPGDRLPSERDVAEQLGVSRPAVREAFSALVTMGLIEVRPGSGTYVKQGDIVMPFAVLPAVMAEETEKREMVEVRVSIEAETAALAAMRATEADLETIRLTLERMEQDQDTGDLGDAADWDFHMAVTVASHNSLMVRVMQHLQDAMRRNLETARQRLFRIPGMAATLLAEHKAIYAAIVARDPKKARKLMVDHILAAQRNSHL